MTSLIVLFDLCRQHVSTSTRRCINIVTTAAVDIIIIIFIIIIRPIIVVVIFYGHPFQQSHSERHRFAND